MNENKKIEKIKPETLLTLALEILDQSSDFKYISGIQPFLMAFGNKKYYVYLKNISSAYFSDRDKTTRAQLPIKAEFDSIKSSVYPFVFLGYDGANDVFVCWNFHVAKERLNVGKSVSFYSRIFFQSEVKDGEFIRKRLKNGDLPVLFKRSYLINFFIKIDTFFPITKSSNNFNQKIISKYNFKDGKLERINEIELLDKIAPYIKSKRFLSAAQIVGNYYQDKYPKMELSDWIHLVSNIK